MELDEAFVAGIALMFFGAMLGGLLVGAWASVDALLDVVTLTERRGGGLVGLLVCLAPLIGVPTFLYATWRP